MTITLGEETTVGNGATNLTFSANNLVRTKGSRQEYAEELPEGTTVAVDVFRRAGVTREVREKQSRNLGDFFNKGVLRRRRKKFDFQSFGRTTEKVRR